jgi:hypothetical protein
MADTGVKIARGILYVAGCVAAVILVIALLVLAYNTAMNTTNVNMIAKDAFARRAQAVLLPSGDYSDRTALEKLFTPRALADDPTLNSGYYDAFEITNYYEHADVELSIVWPWQEEAVLEVVEVVRDINGELAERNESAVEDAVAEEPPLIRWTNGVYKVTMKKDKVTETWRVNEMELIEYIVFNEDDDTPSLSDYTRVPADGTQMTALPEPSAQPE